MYEGVMVIETPKLWAKLNVEPYKFLNYENDN